MPLVLLLRARGDNFSEKPIYMDRKFRKEFIIMICMVGILFMICTLIQIEVLCIFLELITKTAISLIYRDFTCLLTTCLLPSFYTSHYIIDMMLFKSITVEYYLLTACIVVYNNLISIRHLDVICTIILKITKNVICHSYNKYYETLSIHHITMIGIMNRRDKFTFSVYIINKQYNVSISHTSRFSERNCIEIKF